MTPTMSSGRAKVRAMYEQRRRRIRQRRESFLNAIESANTSPTRHRAPPPSSDCHSDSTLFDEWERKSASSGDILDDLDCSNHRHNNSPSSEGPGPHLTPRDTNTSSSGGANTSSGGANTSSSAHGGNITSSSDSTGLITKLIATTVMNKENVRPEHYEDARNNNLVNNLVNSDNDTQKLEPISEEVHSFIDNTLYHLPEGGGEGIHSLMDNTLCDIAGGGGEGFQSHLSGFSNLNFSAHEIPRFSVISPLRDSLTNRESSIPIPIPIYTARNNSKDIEGEYVMLRSPFSEAGDYVTLKAPSRPPSSHRNANYSMMSFCDQLEPSMLLPPDSQQIPWNTSAFNVTGNFGPRNIITVSQMISPHVSPRKDSPKYAKSQAIKELYTKDRSLRDIGNISRISTRSLFNNTMDYNTTLSSTFGIQSPEMYPLNSTEIADMSQLQPVEDNSDDTLENIGDDDPRSFVDSSAISYQAPNATRQSLQSPNSMDDSFLSNPKDPKYNPEDFVTPKRKLPKKPQLCKEHGVHPTLGGPCIFEDSFEGLDSSTEEEENSERSSRSRARSSRHSGTGSRAATDTDCDSSYLSECVDDTAHNMSRQTNDRYMYDAPNARMRLLRRQTGQTDIKNVRPCLGLSESDLVFEKKSRKHLSLVATRASLPDLTNVATASECSGDQDSTLKLTDQEQSHIAQKTPQHLNHPTQQGRPLSISTTVTTTTEESPESNGPGIPVPVNSPNATDSGSSRPTTDNYDYVDIPLRDNIPKYDMRMPPPRKIPARRHPGVGSSFVETGGRPYRATGSSGNEPKAKRNISGSLGSLPHRQFSTLNSSQETLNHPQQYRSQQSLRYHTDRYSDEAMPGPGTSTRHPPRYPRSTDSSLDPRSRHRSRSRGQEPDDRLRNRHPSRTPMPVPEPHITSQSLSRERKKVLAKKLKQFSNTFHTSTGNLQIKTLGHF